MKKDSHTATALEESLRRFAEAHPRRSGPTCWVCQLPERPVLEAQQKEGVGYSTMLRWLQATPDEGGRGYPRTLATLNKISHHFREHVSK